MAYTSKNNVDPIVDVRLIGKDRHRITMNWLMLLIKIPDWQYLKMAQVVATQVVTEGKWPQKKYFFNKHEDCNISPRMLVFEVDVVQRMEAVKNSL